MNYLTFQPAFDVFHTEFRFLRLRRLMESGIAWHYDQLRIADFYMLFFFRLQDVRLARQHTSIKKFAHKVGEGRYERQPDNALIFGRMERIQRAAIGTLIAKEFFDAESFKNELVVETDLVEPEAVSQRIDAINRQETEIMQFIQVLIADYALLGPNGLKDRTGLLEYRYDAI
ncbi:ABC-three component system middle component 5 [Lysobacter antibioticus]|uniref:ABC-three component system middle component 5 n=1 Tax=Lysobacter antibioticus TaxID=84531 RepID=UPI0004D0183D|nr:ABC-three component system middle component 5 [Lysobacter antibioticus]